MQGYVLVRTRRRSNPRRTQITSGGICPSWARTTARVVATAHNRETAHPIIRSAEPGEDWSWCYVEEVAFSLPRH